MKELTVQDVSPKAVRSAQLWLWGYLTTTEPQDKHYEYDEWNHSDGWDLNLHHVENLVRVSAYPFVDGETDYDRWVCVAEGSVPSQDEDEDENVVPQERCERCGEETPNGAGHFRDKLGTEERICGECYKKEMSERMGINNWAFAHADLASQILGGK
jgi:hypothetical protein